MLAFVFPGQGAQKVGMGRQLADEFAVARYTFEEADDALGFSISRSCFEGPEDELKRTAVSQPAILTASVAALRVVERETDLRPELVAGHSLGEYSALVCAGSLAFSDAVRLVHKRGLFMQEAVPEGAGAMAALIGLDGAAVRAICDEAARDQVVSPANINGGAQIVIAGHTQAVQRAMVLAKQQRAKAIPLRVSAPFHCALMEPAARRLARELSRVVFGPLEVPVVTNVEARENSDATRVAALLEAQVTAPVLWEASVQRMVALGVTEVLELGPGNVLSGLIGRITGGAMSVSNLETPAQLAALSRLAASGSFATASFASAEGAGDKRRTA